MKRTGRQKDIVTPEKKQEQRELLRLFSANIRKILKNTDLLADDLQEIRGPARRFWWSQRIRSTF